MDTKTAPADKSDECCFFIGIVLFGREVITLSNPLALRLRKPRIYRTKKAPLQVLLGFWFYFAAQRQCSFASAERLLCQTFLYCNRTCNAFIEPKKHLCRCFWVLWFYFAAQRQCSFASAERLLCKSFLYCNRTCNRSTNHRVVAHADEAHHFDVCGNG